MSTNRRILFVLAFLLSGTIASAQAFTNKGKEFWVGYGHHQFMETGTNTMNMILYLSAEQPANVTVRIWGSGTPFNPLGYVKTYNIPANTVIVTENMPKGATDAGPSGSNPNFDARLFDYPFPIGTGGEGLWTKKGIQITSDVPIVAYAHIWGNTSSGATMLMPVHTWGYSYTAVNSDQQYADNCYSWMYVVAKDDNTKVRITPSVVTKGNKPAGVPFDVILNKGEMYQIIGKTTGSTGLELTGTTVESIAFSPTSCPNVISVFSGSSRTSNPASCGSGGGDNDNQQLFPHTAWGSKFLTAPTSNSTTPANPMTNTYKVVIKEPGTVVTRNGVTLSGLNQNHYVFESTTADIIESNKPIMVAQFMTGGGCLGNPGSLGDPEMIVISPMEQASKKVAFFRNNRESISVNYLTLIIPTAGIPSLRIDGSAAVSYSYAHPRLAGYSVVIKRWDGFPAYPAPPPGQCIVTSDYAFTAITYGLGSVESYGYNAGTNILNLNGITELDNTLDSTATVNEYTCRKTPVKISALIAYQATKLVWQLSTLSSVMSPSADVTMDNPVHSGTVVINGITYYRYTLPLEYVFSKAGTHYLPVIATSPTVGACTKTEELSLPILVKESPVTDFTFTQTAGCGNQVCFNSPTNAAVGFTVKHWRWEIPVAGSTDSTQFPCKTLSNGAYNIYNKIITTEGCLGDTTKSININFASVNPVTVSPNSTICEGASTTLTASGASTYIWSPSTGLSSSTGSSVTANPTVTTTYTVTGDVGGCTYSKSVTVTVTPKPAPPSVTPTRTYCQGDFAPPLSAAATAGNTVLWYLNAALTGGTPFAPNPNTGSAGTTTYWVTQRTPGPGNCLSLPSTITVTVQASITNNNNIGPAQVICGGTAPNSISSPSSPAGGDGTYAYQWEKSTDGGTTWTPISGATTASYTPPSSTGTIKYRRVVTSGLCNSISNVVEVTVQGSLTDVDISANQTICDGSSPNLIAGQQPIGGDGSFAYQWESSLNSSTWSAVSGATSKDYQPPILNDTIYYRRKVTSGICVGTSNVVTIAVNSKPDGTITGTAGVCDYDPYTVNFTATAGTPSFNVQLVVTGPAGYSNTINQAITGMGPTPITVLPANSAAGSYRVILTSLTDNYGCVRNNVDTVDFVVTAKPVLIISPNTAICAGSNTTLTVSGAATYVWSPAIGLSNTTGSSVVASPTGTITYTVTGSNGSCSSLATVTVTINPIPAKPTVTTPVTYCQGDGATALTATAEAGNTLTWFSDAALTVQLPGAPTPLTSTAGSTIYYVTQTTSENCRSSAESINVVVQPSITGNTISADQTICDGTTPAAITGGSLNGGNGAFTYAWFQSTDGGATWTVVSGATTGALTPAATSGTVKYRRVVNSGKCSNTSNIVTITVNPQITNISIAAAQTICEGVAPASLTGQLPTGGNGTYTYQWQSSPDGTNFTNVPGANSKDYQPPVLSTSIHYRRITTSVPCTATSNSVLITVVPTANGNITGMTVCEYQAASVTFAGTTGTAPYTIQLNVTGPGGYTNTISQSVGATATIPVLPANSTPGTYSVMISSLSDANTCVRTTGFTGATIIVNAKPSLTVSPNTAICAGGNTTLTVSGGTTYTWAPATGLSSTTGSSVTANPAGTTTYTVTGTTNGCTSTATVTVTVNPVPAKPTVSTPVTYCQGDGAVALSASASAGNTLTWYDNPGLTGGVPNAYTPLTGTAGGTSYFVTQTNSFNCTSQPEMIMVIVQPSIANNSISADQLLCSGSSAVPVGSASQPTGGAGTYTYQWQQSTDGGTVWTNIAGSTGLTYNPGALATTTQYRRLVASGMCNSVSNVVTVAVQGAVSNTGITGNQTVCSGTAPAMLDGQPAGPVTYQWEISTNNSTWTNINGATSEDYQPDILTATTYYRRKVSNGACSSTSGSVTITVNALPNGAITGTTACEYDPASITFASSAGTAPFSVVLNISGPGGYTSSMTRSVPATATISVLPANSAPGTYTVAFASITDNNGCSRTGLTSATINITARPVLNIPTTVPGCQGTNTTLTVSGASTYVWSPATGLSSTTGSTVTANPASTTTYTVTGTANGCSSSAPVTVTVNPRPNASFTVDNNVCQESQATFVPSTTSNNVTSWKWDFGDGTGVQTNTNGFSFTRPYNTANTFTVKMVTVDGNNCVSDTATQTITVRPKPLADFTLPTSICLPNGVADFRNTSAITGNTALTYVWDLGDQSPTVTTKDVSHVYAANGPYNITLTATSTYGCTDVESKLLNSNAFFDKPIAKFSVAPEALCQGMDNVFTDESSAPNSTITSWRWNFDDGTAISTTRNPTRRYKNPGSYEVALVVTNAVGCVSDTAKKEVTVYLQPVIDAGPSFVVTAGTIVNFKPKVNDSTISFSWSPSSDFTDASKLQQTLVAFKDQKYTLTAVGDGGCTASDTLVIKILNAIKIPNAFSPNGDGINDTWEIPYLKDYPGATVHVYNRFGQQVFMAYGYGRPWDGNYNGKPLPVATYYYVITLKNGFAPVSGSVTIVK